MSTTGGGMDIAKLRSMQKDIKKKAGGDGDNLFIYSNKLPEEQDIRILEPLPNLGGVYFHARDGWWIDGKFYVTNASFDGVDVIKDEIEKAKVKAKSDKELNALLTAKSDNGAAKLKHELNYLIPVIAYDTKLDNNGDIISMDVIDDAPKVLVAKTTLLVSINAIVTSRNYQNGTPFGIADRVKGWNLTVGKQGKGLDTTYSALGWTQQTEIDAKYTAPDVLAIVEKSLKSDAHLRSVIRNYLYGEPILEEETQERESEAVEEIRNEDREDAQKEQTASARPSRSAKPAEAPKKGEEVTSRGRATTRNLMDDALTELED